MNRICYLIEFFIFSVTRSEQKKGGAGRRTRIFLANADRARREPPWRQVRLAVLRGNR